MKIWCFEDPHDWGERLYRTAKARGHDAHMFETYPEPDEGYVFVHMHHHPQLRADHKELMENLSLNPKLVLIPDYRSAVLYDDKLEQARHLARWMPTTRAFFSPSAAKAYLRTEPKYPFISKSSEGASSHNVRLISTPEQAFAEVKAAFSDKGIKMHYELAQRGYVLWQEFIENNPFDIRILGVGEKRIVLRRHNRKDRPMASGSGDLEPITQLDDGVFSALQYADCFFRQERFDWCGIDLVRDAQRWYILETTVGWNMGGYVKCAVWERRPLNAWDKTNHLGVDIWHVLIDEIEKGHFDRARLAMEKIA